MNWPNVHFGGPRFCAVNGYRQTTQSRGSATFRATVLLAAFSCLIGTVTVRAQAPEPPRQRPPLTDEQKAQMERRANEAWSKLPPEAKAQALRLHTAFTQMPPEERKFIHDRIGRFLNMSPEERARLRQNAERWKTMNPEEREQARQKFRQRRLEFEKQWRAEHPGEEPPPFPPRGQRPLPTENQKPTTENPPKETP